MRKSCQGSSRPRSARGGPARDGRRVACATRARRAHWPLVLRGDEIFTDDDDSRLWRVEIGGAADKLDFSSEGVNIGLGLEVARDASSVVLGAVGEILVLARQPAGSFKVRHLVPISGSLLTMAISPEG